MVDRGAWGGWQIGQSLTHCPPYTHLLQLQALGKGKKDHSSVAEAAVSEEDFRAEHKRRMLFGQAHPRTAASTASQRALPAAGGPGAAAGTAMGSPSAAMPASPARSAGGGVASPAGGRSAGPSGGGTPRGFPSKAFDDVAGADVAGTGQVFPSLQGAAATLGSSSREPCAANAVHEEPGCVTGASQDATGAQAAEPAAAVTADPAATALLGQQPGGGGAGGGGKALHTPRWAKQLASGAKKGFTKLRDSLQDQ